MAALASTGWSTAASSAPETGRDIQPFALGGATYLSLAVPLVGFQTEPVGVYLLQQSLDQALAFLHSLRQTLLYTGVVAVGLALLISFVLARGITRPVQQLVQGAEAVGRGDYQYRIEDVSSYNELGVQARAYNTMTTQLAAQISALDWQVSGEKGAARILEMKPTTLEAQMKKLGIRCTGRNARPSVTFPIFWDQPALPNGTITRRPNIA